MISFSLSFHVYCILATDMKGSINLADAKTAHANPGALPLDVQLCPSNVERSGTHMSR